MDHPSLMVVHIRCPCRQALGTGSSCSQVLVHGVLQVSQVVKCARRHDNRVVPRGGGASFEGGSAVGPRLCHPVRAMESVAVAST